MLNELYVLMLMIGPGRTLMLWSHRAVAATGGVWHSKGTGLRGGTGGGRSISNSTPRQSRSSDPSRRRPRLDFSRHSWTALATSCTILDSEHREAWSLINQGRCINPFGPVSLAGSEIMKIAYAIDVKEKDDPYILTAEHAIESISATTNAGSYLVDTLTFCKYTVFRVYCY